MPTVVPLPISTPLRFTETSVPDAATVQVSAAVPRTCGSPFTVTWTGPPPVTSAREPRVKAVAACRMLTRSWTESSTAVTAAPV